MSDGAILTERLRGRTLRDLAEANDMTPEGIRVVVAREGRKQIDSIELALLAGTKTDELTALVVPGHGGPDFDLALEYLRWVVAELTERGIRVRIHYRPTHNGFVIALEDVTRPRRARA
jgi:hypothetical protein